MARFVLIDHSVTSPGGHNFEHANDMLHAAAAMGFEPVLAANREIAGRSDLPSSWRILPLFPDSWDSLHWIGPDGRSHHPADIEGQLLPRTPGGVGPRGMWAKCEYWRTRVRDTLRYRSRRRYLLRLEDACAQLWNSLRVTSDDRVFLPSITEFDLLGLVRFLKRVPETKAVDWHMMFHFNLFAARMPTYASQEMTRDRFRRLFAAALAHVPDHRLHFYGVTDLIADQYNRLETATFTELPYTINGGIHVHSESEETRPLRLTCPGVIRRAKGKRQIRSLVRRLWSDHLQSGGIQLAFQGKAKDLRRFFPKESFAHSEFCETPETRTNAPIVIVRHPLDAADYAQLIRGSHIGLFLHDSERYFSRCSGTLVELLGAGVPVIVPAGCWLAEQIAEPINEHLDQLVGSDAALVTLGGPQLHWMVAPSCRGRVSASLGLPFGARKDRAVCDMPIPGGAVNTVFSFTWPTETEMGHYIRTEAVQLDVRGRPVAERQVSVVGLRPGGGATSTMFSVHAKATALRLTLRNAFDNTVLYANSPQLTFLQPTAQRPAGHPGGQVGLIAADLAQYSRLLSDMSTHYSHYRQSAVEFSHGWSRQHSAFAVIDQLIAASGPPANRDVAA